MGSFYAVSNSDYSVYSKNTRTNFKNMFNKDDIFRDYKNKNIEIGIKKIFFDKSFKKDYIYIDPKKSYNVYVCHHPDKLTYFETNKFTQKNYEDIFYLVHFSDINKINMMEQIWPLFAGFHEKLLSYMESVFFNPLTGERLISRNLKSYRWDENIMNFFERITFPDKENYNAYKLEDEKYLVTGGSLLTDQSYKKIIQFKVLYMAFVFCQYDSMNSNWLSTFLPYISQDTIEKIRSLRNENENAFINFNSLLTCYGQKDPPYYSVINIHTNFLSKNNVININKFFYDISKELKNNTIIEAYKKKFQYKFLVTGLHVISLIFYALQKALQKYLFLYFNLEDVLTQEEMQLLNDYENSSPILTCGDKLINFFKLDYESFRKRFFLEQLTPEQFKLVECYIYLFRFFNYKIRNCIFE